METKAKHKETVTMTVEIPKGLRVKLDRLKGIYGCDTVGCAVSSIIDDVRLKDVFKMMADKESDELGIPQSISQSDTIPTTNQPTDESMAANTSFTDEEGKMISFCKKLLIDLKIGDMDELDTYIDSEIVIIENKLLPKRSPVGEIPENIEWGD